MEDFTINILLLAVPTRRLATTGKVRKVKVNMFLCLTKHHAMKAHWGSGGIAATILNLGTRRRVVSFTTGPLFHQGKISGTHWIGGWMGPRAGLDAVGNRKIPGPYWELNPGRPSSFQWV
jgi:hypothetical protein